jgi:FkbM family methyltransferase
MVGPSGKVLAFEPNPNNLRNLRRHIAVNSIRNVEIIDAAVSSTVSVVLRPRL